jgi:hypothetical protein
VKKLLLALVLITGLGEARAQVEGVFGIRLGVPIIVARPIFDLPMGGLHIGLEYNLSESAGSIGARVAWDTLFLLVNRLSADLYYRSPSLEVLGSGTLYAGLGVGAGHVWTEFYREAHLLTGIQFGSGWFVELASGVAFTDEFDLSSPNSPLPIQVGPFLMFNFAFGWALRF